jgi:predicted amidophosphoribosyltransferase
MNEAEGKQAGAVAELPRCEGCGAAIYRAGMCEVCAAKVSKVDHVVEVSPRAWLEPEELRDG